MPASNTTSWAQWSINSYTVTFNSNGGSAVSNITQNYGTSITKPTDPTRTGYTFGGWYNEASLTNPVTWPFNISSNLTFYAKWNINSYTVTFNSNGGSAVTAITQNYGTSITKPTDPTRTGYTFGGWYSNAALTSVVT